jgi:hypothetical protein
VRKALQGIRKKILSQDDVMVVAARRGKENTE